MNTYSEKEIRKVNELLHKILGICEEEILVHEKDGKFYVSNEEKTLDSLKKCSYETLRKVYKILLFYYPRWIAYKAIQNSDDRYKDFSSNNELLIALTSIIDWLANIKNEKRGWERRFISFLEKNLSKKELSKLINNFYVNKEHGKKEKLNSLKEFAKLIYMVRSLIIHYAELGGLYPFQADFDINLEKGKVGAVYYMITPKDFRLFLWKAIFNSLGLNIISGTKSYE